MATRRDYHIRSHSSGWAVTREGAPGAGSVHSTKSEALASATECAKRDRVEIVVHRKNVGVPASEQCPQ